MKAGRESIRSKVATEVLKWEYIQDGLYRDHKGNQVFFNPLKDMNDAWLVVENLRKQCTFLSVVPQTWEYAVYGWCNVGESDPYKTYPVCMIEAETAPLAICLAALKACGVEVEG